MEVKEIVKNLTVEEKISLLSETAPEIDRMEIPRYHHGNEALHGVVRPGNFTVFPQAIAMGASFHPELIEEMAGAISDEGRARHNANHGEMIGGDYDGLYNGLITFWSPNLNVARDPRWGRTGETYGEDPYLIGLLGTAFVKGMQGSDENFIKAVATPKHFVGNNEEHNRFECNADVPRDQYFDYYLKPFEMAVKEGKCEAVMAAYNGINGVPCHANRELLTEILRERWGFQGYVVSDCGAVSHLWDRHKFVETPAQAAAAALKAGVDLECGSCGTLLQVYGNYLKQALEEGLVEESEIDQAVTRVLNARKKLGFLKRTKTPFDTLDESVIGCEKHQNLALEIAEESMVLLKNEENILPIKGRKTICVVGPQATKCQFGDYSGKPVHPPISIMDGLKEEFPNSEILYVPFRKRETLDDFQVIKSDNLYHYENGERLPRIVGSYRTLKDSSERQRRVDGNVDFEWENMAPDPLIQRSHFDIIWEGVLVPSVSGTYEFRVTTNKKECCDMKACHCLKVDGKSPNLTKIPLEAGKEYPIYLEYANAGKLPSVSLSWKCSDGADAAEFEEEINAAAKCDLVLACLGLGTEYESEGRDKTDLNLPQDQVDLVKAVSKVNKNVVVTLYNGSSLTIPWIKENAKAILECWYPGEQGGRAAARILSGRINPSGRLPLTFYQDVSDLPPFDCYDISEGFTYWYAKKTAYPFGYGLSYSEYGYKDLELTENKECLSGSVLVENLGKQAGFEVVQIYTQYLGQEGEPCRLSWTKKLYLEPGESRKVEFTISDMAIKTYDSFEDTMKVRKGVYRVIVAKDAETPVLSAQGKLE